MVGCFNVLDLDEQGLQCTSSSPCLLTLLHSAHSLQLTKIMQLLPSDRGWHRLEALRKCHKSETYPRGKGREENRLTCEYLPELQIS